MIISHKGKFIFFHVPRTGGSAMTHALRENIEHRKVVKSQVNYDTNPYALAEWQGRYHIDGRLHSSYQENESRCSRFPDYFKFAFVRNPWERTFSEFCGHIRDPRNRQWELSMKGLNGFINQFLFTQRSYHSQSWYFCKRDGSLGVDHVACFENWKSEFYYIVDDVLGLDKYEYTDLNKSESSQLDYREFFNSNSIDRIWEYHEKDIEMFDYSFEG